MTTKTEWWVTSVGTILLLVVGIVAWLYHQSTVKYQLKKALRSCDKETSSLAELRETMERICIASTNNPSANEEVIYILRRAINFDKYGENAKALALDMMQFTGEGTNLAPVVSCVEQTNSAKIAKSAFALLASTKHPDANPLLLELGTQAKSSYRASLYVRLLAARQQIDALPLLAKRLRSRTPEVRQATLEALASWGDIKALKLLKQASGELASPELWIAQIHCIKAMPFLRAKEHWQTLVRFFDNCPGKVRAEALCAMVSQVDVDFSASARNLTSGQIARHIYSCFRSNDVSEHQMAVRILSTLRCDNHLGRDDVAQFLVSIYPEANRREREEIWNILKLRKAPEGAELACALIEHGSAPVKERIAAVRYLTSAQDGRYLPFLLSQLMRSSERLSDFVNALYDAVLRLQNDDAITKLVANYPNYKPLQQIRVLVVLAERRSPKLLVCLEDKTTYMRKDVQETAVRLAQALPESMIGDLVDRMLRTRPARQRDLAMLLSEVSKVQSLVVLQAVEERLHQATVRDRFLLAELLQNVPAKGAEPILKKLATDSDPVVSRAAQNALQERQKSGR